MPTMLDLWEQLAACRPVDRAHVLLAFTEPESEPRSLSIGECEARLLALHEAMFGTRLDGYAECPRCGTSLELSVSIPELRAATSARSQPEPIEHRGYQVHLRVLSGADLADAAELTSVANARRLLLERSVVSASRQGRRVSVGRLPASVVERLAQRLAECDPWAESLLVLNCPECRHEWTVLLDTAVFLWTAIRARAQRLVHDVHALASAYGWREADILALSPRRREAYLELVGA